MTHPNKVKGNRSERMFKVAVEELAALHGVRVKVKRIWGSGAGQEVPEIDVTVENDNFPENWQIKVRHKLPTWLLKDIKEGRVRATAIREDGLTEWYVVLPLKDLAEYCWIKEELK